MRTVKASAKGQLTIPKELFDAIGGARELVIVQDGDRLIVVAADDAARKIVDDRAGWEHLGLSSLERLWDNDEDEVWNDV